MKFIAVGTKSGKVYAKGSRADCFRKLQEEYPNTTEHDHFKNRGVQVKQIYPEELRMLKV